MKTILNLLLMFIVPIIIATVIVFVFSLCINLLTGISWDIVSHHPLVLTIYGFLLVLFFLMLLDKHYFDEE